MLTCELIILNVDLFFLGEVIIFKETMDNNNIIERYMEEEGTEPCLAKLRESIFCLS